jgi:membrane protease YdiL (CAAX protease family)
MEAPQLCDGDGDCARSIMLQGDRGRQHYTGCACRSVRARFLGAAHIAGIISTTQPTSSASRLFAGIARGVDHRRAARRDRMAQSVDPALVGGISLLPGPELSAALQLGSTTNNYVLFWLGNIMDITYTAVYDLVFVAILWLGGTYVAKQRWPRQDKILPRGDRWPTLSLYGWRGLMLGGISFGYIVLFYVIAVRFFHGWTPIEAPGGYAVATPFPFLGPLAIGIVPATTEDLLFRLIGITAVLLALKKRWLALLIPGLLWAFAHTSYVTEPIILRGVELTIEAVMLGLFFLRFGVFVTIMSHFVFNAGLTALPLLRSSEPYFVFSGLIVIAAMFVPIIPGAISWLRRRARPIAPMAAPQIDLATVGDVDRLTALAIKDTDWSTLLNDPAVVVVQAVAVQAVTAAARGSTTMARLGSSPPTSSIVTLPRQRVADHLTDVLRERGAKSAGHRRIAWRSRHRLLASQGWQQRVRSQSIAEEKPKGWLSSAYGLAQERDE